MRRAGAEWILRVEEQRREEGATSAIRSDNAEIIGIAEHALGLTRDRVDTLAHFAHLCRRSQRAHPDAFDGRVANLDPIQALDERLHERLDQWLRHQRTT